jgi:hypothetical protein
MMRRNRLVLALPLVLLVAPLGCGRSGNNVWVTGKVLKGGSKYTPPTGQLVYVTFVALEVKDESGKAIMGGEPFTADVDQANATFSVPGRDGYGIPPGKYRIAVTQKMTRETFDATKPQPKKGWKGVDRETDTLANRFSLESSPIVREVKTGEELVIDLDKPTG